MKKLTEIKNEKALYFVSINDRLTDCETLTEAKKILCDYVKEHKKEIEENQDFYNYFIGMYSICIE